MKIGSLLFGAVAVVALAQTVTAGDGCGSATCGGGKKGEAVVGAATAGGLSGTVLQTTNASRYTYVQIDTGKETLWAAGPMFQVKVGDRVDLSDGMTVRNFKSKALDRQFDELYMAGMISLADSNAVGQKMSQLPAGHPAIPGKSEAAVKLPVIEKPQGGKTVAEVWSEKAALKGKTVIVRGQAVKVSKKILGRNWVHLQDGTGRQGSNDLVATTEAEVQEGTVLTMSGIVGTDKDLGSGYFYPVILENATLVKE